MDWDVRTIESLTERMINGGTPDTKVDKYWSGDIPWITGADFKNQRIAIARKHITKEAVENSSTNVVPKGTVLVVTRTGVGKLAIAERDTAISQDITGIVPDRSAILSEFLFWELNFLAPQLKAAHQGTSINGVLRKDLEKFAVPVPSLLEQKKIADILFTVDSAITNTAVAMGSTIKLKEELMRLLFSKGIGHKRFRVVGIGNIPENWDAVSLGQMAAKVGSGITPTGGERVYKKTGRPFLRSQNIGWGRLLLEDVAFVDDETHASFNATEIQVDDVFLNITGASIGRSAVADSRVAGGNVNQHVCIIRTLKDQLHPYFLNYFLLSRFGQKQIESFQAGGNREGLNFGQIRRFEVTHPPFPEQVKIVEILRAVDAQISTQEAEKLKLEEIRKALLAVLLTGKVRT